MQVISYSEKQTFNLGKRLSRFLCPKDIICLYGPLGAGKTIFVKGIAGGLDISKDEVRSPAFVLIHEYRGKIPLYHIDLYRLNNLKDILNIGFEDYLYKDGIVVIEWAQRLDNYLVSCDYLKVEFEIINKNIRKLKFFSIGNHYNLILDKLKK